MDGCVRDDDLLRLFLDGAPSTPKRHLSGWRAWASFCMCVNWQAGAPKLAQLLDFLRGLAEGAALDRGRGRVSSARSVLSAITFTAHKLRLISLLESLDNPLVRSWKSADKWEREPTREAIPLPLAAVCALEQAVVADCAEDTWIICCILLMLHASLRWSDAQRMRVASIVSDGDTIRGWTWRCKTSASGMAWGCLRGGFQSAWGAVFMKGLEMLPTGQDFLLAGPGGGPMSYSCMLGQLRRCLMCYAGFSAEQAQLFTLHSLKCTLLCWGNQLHLSKSLRASQGHHRYTSVSGAVQKYGRDDVIGQIKFQQLVWGAVSGGWIPGIPLHRGVTRLDAFDSLRVPCNNKAEPAIGATAPNDMVPGSDTGPEEEEEEVAGRNLVAPEDVAAWSDGEDSAAPSDGSGDDADEEVSSFSGPWLLNTKTGWFHRAVQLGDDDQWCLACRPRAVLQEHYILHETDPRFDGWTACGHSGCRDS